MNAVAPARATAAADSIIRSAIYEGWIRHRRYAGRRNDFRYRMFQLYLDLSELDGLFRDRWLW
jgi:DUF1365 family protein